MSGQFFVLVVALVVAIVIVVAASAFIVEVVRVAIGKRPSWVAMAVVVLLGCYYALDLALTLIVEGVYVVTGNKPHVGIMGK